MQSIPYLPVRRALAAAGHFRRLKAYDYARGAVLFVSFGVLGRRRVFGSIDSAGTLTHSPVGLAAVVTLRREAARGTGIELKRFVIMPDHVHLRIYIRPGLAKPLALLANFIRNFKRWSQYRAKLLGVDFDWEEGYHDRLCLSREVIDIVDKYIDNNALKWALMHGFPPPLKVIEPFEAPCLPDDEWWSAVGAVELMGDISRLCAVRLSRRLPVTRYKAVVAELLAEARHGTVFIGTFISPCERKLAEALVREGLPMIRVVPDPLALVYRPKGDEPGQFAAGRLLLLSRVVGSLRPGSLRPEGPRDRTPVGRCGHAVGTGREEAWHGINDVLAYLFPRSLYIDH